MTSVIVDRRPDKGKSAANRQRVLKRLDSALKAQVDKLIARKKLKEHDAAVEVSVERKDVKEPSFGLDPATGNTGRVVPGNEHYRVGDKIPRDPSGGKGRGSGSGAGEGDSEENSEDRDLQDLTFGDRLRDVLRNDVEQEVVPAGGNDSHERLARACAGGHDQSRAGLR